MLSSNLVFNGLPEATGTSDCISIVLKFLSDNLQMDPSEIGISHAYRIGRRRVARGRTNPRAILASFVDVRDVNEIMRNVTLLKGTSFGISKDYPREIREASKELWDDYKAARSKYGAKNVKLAFPAALLVHGETVRDLFPGWHEILRGSRNSDAKMRTELRFQHIVDTVSQAEKHRTAQPPASHIPEEIGDPTLDTDSDSGPEMESSDLPAQHVDTDGDGKNIASQTITRPGYLLEKHPVMTSKASIQIASPTSDSPVLPRSSDNSTPVAKNSTEGSA